MTECANCGAHVSADYLRVRVPESELDAEGRPRACPFCPDRVRLGARIRQARSPRHERGRGPAERVSGGDGEDG